MEESIALSIIVKLVRKVLGLEIEVGYEPNATDGVHGDPYMKLLSGSKPREDVTLSYQPEGGVADGVNFGEWCRISFVNILHGCGSQTIEAFHLWVQAKAPKVVTPPDVRAEFTTKELGDAMADAGVEAWVDSQGVLKVKTTDGGFTFTDALLAEAQHKVRGAREVEYGNKLKNFEDIAGIQSFVSGQKRTAEGAALDMVCVKLARLLKSPDHYDTLVDLLGYVMCYRDIRRERNPEEYTMQEERFRHELKNKG